LPRLRSHIAVAIAGLKLKLTWEARPMNAFDKLCAVLAIPLGLALVLLGAFGLFAGCRAQFSLPPILGVLPAFIGWGIIRAVWCGWSAKRGSNNAAMIIN
jgi:hypothetical protein